MEREAASGGDVTPTAIYQDALENPIPSTMDISHALNSILQNRESLAIEKINPPSQSPNKIDLGEKNDFNETTIMIPRTEVDRRCREMKNIGPFNRPGLSELAPLKPQRSRSPSYQKAKLLYDEALDSIHEELDAF